jgi:predicted metal-dependent hydrolase
MMFLDAPERVIEALVRYVVDGDREGSDQVGSFIEKNSHRIRAVRRIRGRVKTRGRVHDLERVLADVSERYLGSETPPDVLISWGKHTHPTQKKKGRKTIKLGSYSATERLIRIHPALDKEWVPRYFLSYIVYHELLHHLIPAVKDGGRAMLHGPDFLRREREFRHYERAIAWERKNIHRLLGTR